MRYKNLFMMPKSIKITARTSSITNAFVNDIIPAIEPTNDEIEEALDALGMDAETICCAYCGDKYTEWDHFRPLVVEKKPTGYITEIHNLVPACGKCNQSKGNKGWRQWMTSTASLSPATRKVNNLELLIRNLDNYEKWSKPKQLDFAPIVGNDLWERHWRNWDAVLSVMRESQKISDIIRTKILEYLHTN